MILTSAAGRTKVTNVYLCTTSSRSLGGTFQTSDWCASVPQCISTQLRASGVLWFQASFRLLKHLGRKKLPTHKLKTPKNCMEKPVFAVDDWKLFESKDIYSGEMWRDVESIDSPHKICGASPSARYFGTWGTWINSLNQSSESLSSLEMFHAAYVEYCRFCLQNPYNNRILYKLLHV